MARYRRLSINTSYRHDVRLRQPARHVHRHLLNNSPIWDIIMKPHIIYAPLQTQHTQRFGMAKTKLPLTSAKYFQSSPADKGISRVGAYIGKGAYIDHDFNSIDVCIVLPTHKVTSKYLRHYKREKFKRTFCATVILPRTFNFPIINHFRYGINIMSSLKAILKFLP